MSAATRNPDSRNGVVLLVVLLLILALAIGVTAAVHTGKLRVELADAGRRLVQRFSPPRPPPLNPRRVQAPAAAPGETAGRSAPGG